MNTFFKMKHNEWKVKNEIYNIALDCLHSKSDFIDFIKRLYTALKDTPVNELQQKFIQEIALLAHEQAVKEREKEQEK